LLVHGPIGLDLAGARPSAAAWLFVGLSRIDAPLLGGTLVPSPDLVVAPLFTDAGGEIAIATLLPPQVPLGATLHFQYWIQDPQAPFGAAASNALRGDVPLGPVGGSFPAQWISGGPDCGTEPAIQIHAYNPDTYILRQSLCTNFEAPFLYLLFGSDKALLLDTGAGGIQIYAAVKGLVDAWLLANGKSSIELIVAHSHAHGDHVAGDSQFNGKPNVTVVGTSQTAVKNFFGIATWPTQIVAYDLGGGRVLDVIPIPGHHGAHIAIYDRRTANLLTGDSLYPGRLYVNGAASQGQWNVYKASVQRLVDFTATRDLCHVLGTHIEMTSTPTVDFPLGSTHHPNEHVLQLGRSHLLELDATLDTLPTPMLKKLASFIIYPIG
jgi:hydroxyacylglutathione hydrolase